MRARAPPGMVRVNNEPRPTADSRSTVAAVRLHDRVDDGQPEAGAVGRSRGPPRWKRSNTRWLSSNGIPAPVSRTHQ